MGTLNITPTGGSFEPDSAEEAKRWERQRTDADDPGDVAPTAHDELPGEAIIVIDEGGDVVEEDTSAQVAAIAARLLGMPNILMRASSYHPAVLQAVKDSGFKVDGKMLDLLEGLAQAIEPFMRDVRSVAGSALTQFEGGLGAIAEEPGDE